MARAIHLLRHADAGERADWSGPDFERPLSTFGASQAALIASELERRPVARLVSSPARRCVATLEPLAHRLERPVELAAYLAEGRDPEAVLAHLVEDALGLAADEELAACSHGDIVPAVIEELVRCGVDLSGPRSAPKAVTFTLELDDGHVARILRVAPPRPRRGRA